MREVSVTRLRLERFGAALVLGAVLSGPLAVEAYAQARVDANYVASLAGFTVGKGSWTIHLNGDSYVAAASGGTTGILRAFSSGSGTSAGRGKIDGTKALDAHYQATLDIAKKSDAIQIELLNGNVKAFSISPEPPADAERVPVTEAMRRGVKDPMNAALIRVPGKADPVSAEACKTTLSVFDGRMRYDVALSFRRIDQVHAQKGYAGPAVVCGAAFTPIGGHNPNRKAVKYIMTQRDIEVWLAPIAGTRVLVPFRVVSPTPIGQAVVEARQFVVSPVPIPAGIKAP